MARAHGGRPGRAARSAQQKQWWLYHPEARLEARRRAQARWAWQHPERAAVRAELMRTLAPEACDRCGSDEAVLFLGDVEKRTVIWRCRHCAARARDEYRKARRSAAASGDPGATCDRCGAPTKGVYTDFATREVVSRCGPCAEQASRPGRRSPADWLK